MNELPAPLEFFDDGEYLLKIGDCGSRSKRALIGKPVGGKYSTGPLARRRERDSDRTTGMLASKT